MNAAELSTVSKCPTGIEGLDRILKGGLPRNRIYVIQGDPGVGKTTLGLQFLLRGQQDGEKGLYIALSETLEELREIAASHGWSLDGLHVLELSAIEHELSAERENTVFAPSEVELQHTVDVLLREIERTKPSRVVFDSLSEMQLLTQNPLRYRRQMLSLKQFFTGRKCTALLLDDMAIEAPQARTLAHGVITLEHRPPTYGSDRRQLRIVKLRGVAFTGGYHDFDIRTGGIVVYPRLVAADDRPTPFKWETISTGVAPLDALLGGGIDRGTSTLILGPSGVGKTMLTIQFTTAVCDRGERVAAYLFDENRDLYLRRSGPLGDRLREHVRHGAMHVQQIDPAEMSSGELIARIREQVQQQHVRVVVLDSLNGYLKSIPDERHILLQLHELLSYLGQRGITTLMLLAQSGLVQRMDSPADMTYLSDMVILLRYFEAAGAVKQAVSVFKKRTGGHERAIREFSIVDGSIRVGEPLSAFHGILSGVPTYTGPKDAMLESNHAED